MGKYNNNNIYEYMCVLMHHTVFKMIYFYSKSKLVSQTNSKRLLKINFLFYHSLSVCTNIM